MAARRTSVRVRYRPAMLPLLFPRLSIAATILTALSRAVAVMVVTLWPYRREVCAATVVYAVWRGLGRGLPDPWPAVTTLALVAGVLTVPGVRRAVLGWLACGRTRRWLLAGFAQTRTADLDGHAPRIVRLRRTPIGERIWLRLRPGQSAELLTNRIPELRAAVRSRDLRVTRDPAHADRVTLDIVRRDTLAGGVVEWADRNADVLSIWDPVHWGISELGRPVRLSLVERAVLIGGNRGAGKSSGINVFMAHAAKSPDVQLLLIDPNRVQLVAWADRALGFADHNPDDAIDLVRLWRDEIDRRLELFTTLPGVPIALSRQLAGEHQLPMWLLVVDELAYHTSVAGTPAQQKTFYNLLRDGVARGRAAGMGAIVATQRPTHDLIPTSLRDLFDIRIAYRTMTRTSSDVILGDDFAHRGYCATDIDLGARGVAWLLGEDPTPIRTKTAWIPPELRAELAITTVRYRPTPPPGLIGGVQ